MAISAQRVFTPRTRNLQQNNFQGTIDGVAYRATNFRLIESSLPGPFGPHWEARVHERAANWTYKEVTIYIPRDVENGEHALASNPKIVVSYVDYFDPQNPSAHKSISGTIDFALDTTNKVITGTLHANMDDPGSNETFLINVQNFVIFAS